MAPETSTGQVFPRLILSGHAKLPKDAVARAVWEILSIVVAVDPATGIVLEADATLVTEPAKKFLKDLMVGRSLAQSPEIAVTTIEDYYWGGAKRALMAAVRELYDKWTEWSSTKQAGGGTAK